MDLREDGGKTFQRKDDPAAFLWNVLCIPWDNEFLIFSPYYLYSTTTSCVYLHISDSIFVVSSAL